MGRQRKQGERYSSGKLKPMCALITGLEWQQLRMLARRQLIDPRIATELGRLNLFGEMTNAQTVAGQRIGNIYGRYEALKGLPRSAKSPSYMVGSSGFELLDDAALAKLKKDIADATEAFDTLRREIPHSLRAVVEALCVEDRAINPMAYPSLRILFQRLAVKWKMTGAAAREEGRHGPPLHFNRHEGDDFGQAKADRDRFRRDKERRCAAVSP